MSAHPDHGPDGPSAAVTRILDDSERPFPAIAQSLPLVFAARGAGSASALKAVARARSAEIREHMHRHGAVLLRGFPVESPQDFEQAMAELPFLRPMNRYFMSEPGRQLVPGTRHVFNTNSVARTGGGFVFGVFHAENYHSPDVPTYVSFCARKRSWLGSETCLVNMADVYAELPAALRHKLEAQPCAASIWPLSAIADRYGLEPDEAARRCSAAGLIVVADEGKRYVILTKPSVYRHPQTGRLSLQVNLFTTLPTFKGAALRQFLRHYTGPAWSLHRLVWRSRIDNPLFALGAATRLVVQPVEARKFLREVLPELDRRTVGKRAFAAALIENVRAFLRNDGLHAVLARKGMPTLADLVSRDDIEALAAAIEKHASMFFWQKGDILIFDNQQLLHAGMPGFGPRELLAMFFNPLPLDRPAHSGIAELRDGDRDTPVEFMPVVEQVARSGPDSAWTERPGRAPHPR
jgi:alpha-ketoglutarate-dependent taurine dioxygenase